MQIAMFVQLLGGLGLFLYGMTIMSEGLQRVARDNLRSFLRTLTQNRIAGVFTGVAVTSIVQSSSATTVMLVGFVNAGLLNLTQSIGVIMGANIGTTVTGWLVALVGFHVNIASLALPAIGIGFFVRFIGKQRVTDWGVVLLGFGLLFLGLTFMKDSVGELRKSQEVMQWLTHTHVTGLGSYLVAILVGSAITVIVQSSSATMALTMAVAQQGLIDFPTAAALLLGENIGTTITANLAAIGASAAAKQTARAHLLFNLTGVLWMLPIFWWFMGMVDAIVPGDAMGTELVHRAVALPDHMAAFHSIFNIANTLLLLPFVSGLAYVARRLVAAPRVSNGLSTRRVQLINTRLLATPGLAMEEAHQALNYMGMRALEGIDTMVELLTTAKVRDYERKSQEVRAIEQELDDLEEGLTQFIIKLSQGSLSPRVSLEINAVSGSAHDLERIGDHLNTLQHLDQRRRRAGIEFPPDALEDLRELAADVHDIVQLVTRGIIEKPKTLLREAHILEEDINRRRHEMRKGHIKRLRDQSVDAKAGIQFIEILTSFEKIGDHAYNIAQDFAPTDQL